MGPRSSRRSGWRLVYWLAPLLALVVAIVAGMIAYALTRPDPDGHARHGCSVLIVRYDAFACPATNSVDRAVGSLDSFRGTAVAEVPGGPRIWMMG